MNPTLGHQQKGREMPRIKANHGMTGLQLVMGWLADCIEQAEAAGYEQSDEHNSAWYRALRRKHPSFSVSESHVDVQLPDGRTYRLTATELKP